MLPLYFKAISICKFIQAAVLIVLYEDNAIRKEYDYPKRGNRIMIGMVNLLVANQPSYDVMIIPREVRAFRHADEFCKLIEDYLKEDFMIKPTIKRATRLFS